MNERGAWKIDANGGFANFTEGDRYDTAAMDSLGDIHTRPNGPDARAPQPPKFRRIINPAEWEGLPVPPREWIVPGYIPHKTVTLLSGDGSVGKSLHCNSRQGGLWRESGSGSCRNQAGP